MTFMTWTAAQFGTKIAAPDGEHQQIFSMVNDLHASIGQDRSSVGQKLDALIAFVAKHFQTEEQLMHEHGFPEFVAHKSAHDNLVAACLDLQKKFKAGQAEVTQETTSFVKEWLYSHIPSVDRKYGPYLNAKGVN